MLLLKVSCVLAAGALTILFSYALAVAGEPRAVWFWRDVLGVIG